MSSPAVILYRYDASPYSHKIDNVLALKKIPHSIVNVAPMLPRPEITDMLGVTYRRIPILAIGNDVYCDTAAIVAALERRFPTSQGYGTIFPPAATSAGERTDVDIVTAFARFYAEATMFPLAVNTMTWSKVPDAFLKDRSELRGSPIDVKAIAANRPVALATLSSHITSLEQQLADGRAFLFATTAPSLADISVHFIFNWVRGFPGTKELFDAKRTPKVVEWLARVTSRLQFLKSSLPKPTLLKGAEAAAAIIRAAHEAYDVAGFDEVEAQRLGVRRGATVKVAPEDTGRAWPTIGMLVALTHEEVTLEVKGPKAKGTVRVHFPRLGFSVRPISDGAAKL
ncbi:hypothetical protein D9619_000286 [Psilocybe cf. subviscida]|uniref:GST N-terminal domain-containing protein n=1 Tax=Psilocybe cf. subviscida TaxID=2480587 RepID=A0A8H5BET5_9AGAR|nr:hypothetical protein D9619_000286 [Psilocybe cf. subviscida]